MFSYFVEKDENSQYSLPLAIFDKTYLAPYVAIQHIDDLQTRDSFLVGSSKYPGRDSDIDGLGNLLYSTALPCDLVVDNENVLNWKSDSLKKKLKLTSKDKRFIDFVIYHVEDSIEQGMLERMTEN